ncbi:MAG: hypothetical protein DLM55_12530 [Acidimicrobiales bacterium]|nr:MAG: hypothetical protein DLM55_12530 [Acidimicrobiales bacterium]
MPRMQKLRVSTPQNDGLVFDVIGVGALNVDYIARAQAASAGWTQSIVAVLSAMVPKLNPPLRWNTERLAAESPVWAPWVVPPDDVTVELGGSAFNTIHALAHTRIGAKVGYVGVAGNTPPSVDSFEQAFDKAGVDRSFVRSRSEQPAGVCLSVLEHGEPTMLTYPGVNLAMAAYLEAEANAIVEYLASARVIHVTSLLDGESPKHLLRVLREVKRRSPATVISFDPGFAWCMDFTGVLADFADVSDIMSMNQLELFAAASCSSMADDKHAARLVVDRFMGGRGILIARAPGSVTYYQASKDTFTTQTHRYVRLPEGEVIDATSAGDVFAAGFLAGFLVDPHDLEVGIALGMKLARTHVQHLGAAGYQYFPAIAADSIRLQASEEVPSDA